MPTSNVLSSAAAARLLADWPAIRSASGDEGPAYRSLAQRLASLVAEARVPLGCRLPAERELARAMGVSRTTVSAAYETLRRHGYLTSRRGAGSWTTLPVGRGGTVRPLPFVHETTDEQLATIDLTLAAPAAGGLAPRLEAAVAEATAELAGFLDGHGYDTFGLRALRESIARRYTERGVATSAEQIVVTSGAQQAIDLILRTLVRPGERVLLESPTYPRALDAVAAHTARAVPLDLGESGWDAEWSAALSATMRQASPALLYTIADFHNPTGQLMPPDVREQLVATAARSGAYLLADETLVDLALEPALAAAMPPPLAAGDRFGRVLSVGSLGKTVWGGLRIGWVRADVQLAQRLAATRSRADMAGPVFEQLVAARLLQASEGYQEILAIRRGELRERRDVLVEALRASVPEWSFVVPSGGLALWLELDRPIGSALSAAGPAQGLRLAPGSRFGADSRFDRRLRVPFTLPSDVLVDAVARLASLRAAVPEREAPRLVDLVV